jgi:hypothetical protein
LADKALMEAFDNWIKRFGISEATWLAFKQNLGPNENPITHGLLLGHISEAEYFEWAMEHFALPSVKTSFFSIPFDQVFWERVKDLHAWQPDLLPLADWEGVLMIACVHPPSDFALRSPHRFVLASPQHLKAIWEKAHPGGISAAPVAREQVTAPAPQPEDTAAFEMPDGFSAEALSGTPPLQNQEPSIETEAAAPSVDDIPEGLAVNLQDLAPETSGESMPEPEATPAAATDLPDGISMDVSAGLLAKLTFGTAKNKPTEPAPATSVATPEPVTAPAAPEPMAAVPEPAPVQMAAAPEPAPAPVAAAPAAAPIEMQMDNVTITNWDLGVVDSIDSSTPLQACTSKEEVALQTMQLAMKAFEGVMVFLMRDQKPTPFRWTNHFMGQGAENAFGGVDLSKPSIFRIVHRSRLPYHGRIAASPENDRFFKAFCGGVHPKHVTLVPVFHEKELLGMIMGIAPQALSYKTTLPYMERVARDTAAAIVRVQAKKAA